MTVIIGVDPHKRTHTAVAIDENEAQIARVEVRADRDQTDRLLAWCEPLDDKRVWAIESAAGLGHLLAQELVAAGEDVIDVPSTLAARVRVLGSERAAKNDRNDAWATAVAGLRHCELRSVRAEDHTMVLRMLCGRYDDLIATRTQTACRLHVALRELVAGGAPRRLGATKAAQVLRRVRPDTAVQAERKHIAQDLLVDLRRLDRDLAAIKTRIATAVADSGTTLTDIHGVGPFVAAYILGQVRDIGRFPTRARFASYNGTAPLEASSGPRARHRLNPRGNRQLNHAIHMIAVTQVSGDTPGRAYYLRKQAEGKTRKEAMRALKRRISDAVWRQLRADQTR